MTKINSGKKYIYGLLIFLVLVISFALRFWKISDNFVFDIDTEYQALLAKTIVNHFHIIWIGVSAANIGYYLGPGLVYLTAFLLKLSSGDPLILGYFASLVGSLTTISLFIIVSNLFKRKIAFTATVIYGFSSFIIFYDRKFWPIFVPFTAIWLYYSLVKARQNPRWLILSSMLIAAAFHIHLTLLVFIPFVLWTFIKNFRKIDAITWIASVAGYLIITFPLLFFDFVHNFDNLLMPVRFLTQLQYKSNSLINNHLNLLFSSLDKIWYMNLGDHKMLSILMILILVTALVFIAGSKKNFAKTLLLQITVLYLVLFCFYPGPIQEYYIVLVFPFIAVVVSLFLDELPFFLILPLFLIFVAVNTTTTIVYKSPNGLSTKKKLIQNVNQKLTDNYYLSFDGDRDYEGWRYLFEAYGKRPAQSQADDMFGWIYPNDISKEKPKLKVTMTGTSFTISRY